VKIACVGAGLAGLAVTWHLLQRLGREVDLFDPGGIAGGASGIASGLLHPFPGKQALLSWRAEEGMAASEELLRVAEEALGRAVCARTGILRADKGLWIPEGKTVFSALYLEGLWRACEKRGGKLVREKVGALEELKEYDGVVVATGFETLRFPECAHLPLKKTPGQVLTCLWKEPLAYSIVADGHIALTEERELCRVGSTYEHGEALSTNVEQELKQKIAKFYPPVLDFEVVDVRSGVRISPKLGYKPIVESVAKNIWVFTGLGSRGMLYHALLGKEVAEKF